MRSLGIALALAFALGCGGGGNGEPGTDPGRYAEVTRVSLTGTLNDKPTGVIQEVKVNGADALVKAGTWSYAGDFDPEVTTITVELLENGTVMAIHEVELSTVSVPLTLRQ